MNAPAAAPKKKSMALPIIIAAVLAVSCVPCIGIVAAVALPAFIGYVRQSKTAEAEGNLRAIAAGAAAYYDQERSGPGGDIVTHCTVGPDITPYAPSDLKYLLDSVGPSFTDLGFFVADPIFFQYEIVAEPSACNHGPNEPLYTLVAHGDLDGDGIQSRFALPIDTDAAGQIRVATELVVENQLE